MRIVGATVAVVGDDLGAEVAARALAAGGVGKLRLVRRSGALPEHVAAAVSGSNPDVELAVVSWPAPGAGAGWLAVLGGCQAVVRVGFDDDPMLRAAVRLGVPVVVLRVMANAIDIVSFRHHGPCPHASLDAPDVAASSPTGDGAAAVVAGELAAAEILLLLAGAEGGTARARHTRLPLDGGDARSTDLPWTPECFACGGSGSEMSFTNDDTSAERAGSQA